MIQLTIQVNDIDTVIQLYQYIRLYRSDEESGTYIHLAYIALLPGTESYTYNDVTGTTDNWYRSSYYSNGGESSLSDPAQGAAPSLFHEVTYSLEAPFDVDQSVIIRKIRRYIGDFPKVQRMYLEDCATRSCEFIHSDGRTIELESRGWPVLISLRTLSDEVVEKTALNDPVVQGYKFLTFSGTLITDDGTCQYNTIDIWYYASKFSDREVYEAYGDAMIPAHVPTDRVTSDHLMLQAAISLLENMTSEDMVEDGAVIYDDASKYDPSPGLTERDKTIKRLKKMLDDLVDEVIRDQLMNVTGVLID